MRRAEVVNSDHRAIFTNGYILNDIEFDRQHIWHPYTSATNPLPCYQVTSAKGVELTLADGRSLIDGMSSWWAAIHGYNHPQLNQAAHEQIDSMSHVMFGGITHQPAIELCRTLLNILPNGLDRVFFGRFGVSSSRGSDKNGLAVLGCSRSPSKVPVIKSS